MLMVKMAIRKAFKRKAVDFSCSSAAPPKRCVMPGGKVWNEWKETNPGTSDHAFLAVIARQLYGTAHRILRTYDKHHLLFGDRYHEVDMPDMVVREALPYIDAIAIQLQFWQGEGPRT